VTARILPVDAPAAMEEAAQVLTQGQLVGIPTETVYGICAVPTPTGVMRLIEAKQRSADKGIQLLVDSIDQAEQLALLNDAATRLGAAFWPGGLTIVLDRRTDGAVTELTELLGGGRPTLGLRLPDHATPRALARRLGPLAASSANVSGQPDATTAELVAASLGDELSLIIDDGPVRGGTPSTVVDCSSAVAGVPRILREGAISAADIAEALR
jgi:tRNA threonylcarbamoyl adenosine modification protein (Sua5/YciO/YrdC/YwlC family)